MKERIWGWRILVVLAAGLVWSVQLGVPAAALLSGSLIERPIIVAAR